MPVERGQYSSACTTRSACSKALSTSPNENVRS
jgi:hypothetical protein